MISNSGSDEHGRYNSGAAGDQTGREWRIIPWYKRPWKCVLRHPDPEVRELIATMAEQGAQNDKIGYDQYERWTFWAELKKVGYYPKNIYSKCEADCSSGVISIVWAVGYILNRAGISRKNHHAAKPVGPYHILDCIPIAFSPLVPSPRALLHRLCDAFTLLRSSSRSGLLLTGMT